MGGLGQQPKHSVDWRMPETVCNTSPLQYLYQWNLLDLLPALYGNVIIPKAVDAEMREGRLLGPWSPRCRPRSSQGRGRHRP